jgi:Domain of unknown function (DUF397)
MSERNWSLRWHRSTRCSSGGCIDVATDETRVHVRDSTDPSGPVLHFTSTAWQSFIDRIKSGALDP